MLHKNISSTFLIALTITLCGHSLNAGPNIARPVGKKTSVYYTFKQGMGGGVAEVVICPQSGKILGQNIIAQSALFVNPHKIKVSECGRYLLATSQHEAISNILLADLQSATHKFLSVPRKPDDIGVHGCTFFIGAEDQAAYAVCANDQKVTVRWNGKHQLYPEGRRIEYVATTPDGTAWTSWQKDSASGRRKGSRVVAIDIASGRTISDIHLPRAMPNLHLADMKEQGPNPEIIIPSVRTNTLLLSMDLYGGVAMADLDAARNGRWQNLTYHCVDPNQKWGVAFPDRGTLYSTRDNDYAFIANAGKNGGVSWVDLRRRQIVQHITTPAGLEAPAIVGNGKFLVAPALGKTKSRVFGELTEGRNPQRELFVFEVLSLAGEPRLRMTSHPLPTFAYRAAPVNPAANDLVFLSAGDKGATEVMIVRGSTGTVVDRAPAVGKIRRIAF